MFVPVQPTNIHWHTRRIAFAPEFLTNRNQCSACCETVTDLLTGYDLRVFLVQFEVIV